MTARTTITADTLQQAKALLTSTFGEGITTLLMLKELVLDGSLDAQISVAADGVKPRFAK